MHGEIPQSPTSHDAQREMEQRALRNVRALVDKIEGEDARSSGAARRGLVVAGVALAVAAVAAVVALGIFGGQREEARTVVIPPPALPAR